MTRSDIESLIIFINDHVSDMAMAGTFYIEDRHGVNGDPIYYKLSALYQLLRDYPVESDKISGPDYKAMYEKCAAELEKTKAHIDSLKFDMHNLSVEHAQYVGAVAAMETIFGRKFGAHR